MTETYAVVTRIDEIQRHWPDGREMPSLIADVANYLRDKPWGSAGEIRWFGDRMNDWWIENGADLAGEFGLFMRLPEGSAIAVWYHEGAVPGVEPIVYIGSEGESYVCGATLAGFFESIASLRDDEQLPPEFRRERDSDFDEDEEVPDERPGLLAYLHSLPDWMPTVTAKKAGTPDIAKRFKDWHAVQIDANTSDPTMQGISRVLDHYIPRGKPPWESASFGISAIGDRVSVYTLNGRNRQPPELPALMPLIQQARAERARTGPEQRGVWHHAGLEFEPDGICRIQADWSDAPPRNSPTSPNQRAPNWNSISRDFRAAHVGSSRGWRH
jgi:hypothetical protein